jgi:hypothetical protein
MCGGWAAYPDCCQSGAGQGVEDARLARSGRPSKRHHSGTSGYRQPSVGLINYAPGFSQRIGVDATIAQLPSFAECVKMINKPYAGILSAEQP